jgi:hypothetical protein
VPQRHRRVDIAVSLQLVVHRADAVVLAVLRHHQTFHDVELRCAHPLTAAAAAAATATATATAAAARLAPPHRAAGRAEWARR